MTADQEIAVSFGKTDMVLKIKPIRILMASASLSITGTHRILMDLITGLDRNKFQVIIAYKPDFPGPGNDLADEIRAAGLEVLSLRGRHLFSIGGLWNLYRIGVVHEVDLIHCWDSLSVAARIVGRLAGAKVIDTIGNPPADDSWKNRLANRVTSPLLNGIIYQSVESREAHQKCGSFMQSKKHREAIIYNAVDFRSLPEYPPEERRRIRNRYGFNEKDVVLVNMGMLNRQKSQEHLVEAMPHILKDHSEVKLMIVGWGEREPLLKESILSRRLEKHICLAGKRRRQEVFDLLSMADIYVSSSLWEGLPVAVLEAMAFRLPVVATDVIGNREAVVDRETGLLVPPRDPGALGKAILTLVQDRNLRKQMGNRGRIRVEMMFHPERFIREHEEFYMDVLGRSHLS